MEREAAFGPLPPLKVRNSYGWQALTLFCLALTIALGRGWVSQHFGWGSPWKFAVLAAYVLWPLSLMAAQVQWQRFGMLNDLMKGGPSMVMGWGFLAKSAAAPLGRRDYIYLSWRGVLVGGRYLPYTGCDVRAELDESAAAPFLRINLVASSKWHRFWVGVMMRRLRVTIEVPVPPEGLERVRWYAAQLVGDHRQELERQRQWKTVQPGTPNT